MGFRFEAFFNEKRAGRVAALIPPQTTGQMPPKDVTMILFVDAILKKIFIMGRNYPWTRPEKCPCCGNWKVWGHGFARTLFQGFDTPLLLKRYRCPVCRCVIKLRPTTHFTRFQSSIHTIRSALTHRIKNGSWPSGSAKSRQRYWLSNLKRQVHAHLTGLWQPQLMDAFDYFLSKGKIPVSRAI
jgi:hypothetical protein